MLARPAPLLAAVPLLLATAALLGACGAGGSGGSKADPSAPIPSRPSHSAAAPAAPSAAAPPARIRVAAARSCPLVPAAFVQDTLGLRLGRLTVLRRAGRPVGCRFYALQDSPLHDSEHLPGPHQPAVAVSVESYPSAVAAHNAVVLAARAGRNPTQVRLGGPVGVCFQTDFDPHDRGADWACGVNVGAVRVLVRTVDTTGTFSSIALTKAVLRHA